MTEVLEVASSDVPRLATFLKRAWKEAGPGTPGWTGATDASMEEIASEGFLAALLAKLQTHVLAADEAGEIVGLAVVQRVASGADELTGLMVLGSRTGRGVGRALLEAAVRLSRAEGARDLLVRTEASNERALRFYQDHGFVIESRGLVDVQGIRVELVTLVRPTSDRDPVRS